MKMHENSDSEFRVFFKFPTFTRVTWPSRSEFYYHYAVLQMAISESSSLEEVCSWLASHGLDEHVVSTIKGY